jgi:hypothetical protein
MAPKKSAPEKIPEAVTALSVLPIARSAKRDAKPG